MRYATAIAAMLVGAAIAAPARAQSANDFSSHRPSQPYTTPSYAPTPPTSPMHHSSTVHEGVARGVSNIIKANADAMLSYSQARILMSEARAREYRLRVINTETHLDRKHLLREAREAERLRKWERRDLGQARLESRKRTVHYTAYRLPAQTLDPRTGHIVWPAALNISEFDDLRNDLEALFVQLANEGPQYDRLYRDRIADLCKTFRDRVARLRKPLDYTWDEYMACQKMLLGLKYGAEYWPGKTPGGGRFASNR